MRKVVNRICNVVHCIHLWCFWYNFRYFIGIPTWRQQHDGRVQSQLGFSKFQRSHGTAHFESQGDQFLFDRVLRVKRVGWQ